MAHQAPAKPTLETLQRKYPLSSATADFVAERRGRTNDAFKRVVPSFVSLVGACALTPQDRKTINHEGNQQDIAMRTHPGLVALQRLCPWKPRTNPMDWHGAETDPKTAGPTYGIIAERAEAAANAAAEIGWKYHLPRYSPRLTLGWLGGRNVENDELVEAAATYDPSLPLAVKNGLDGDVTVALKQVQRINSLRSPDEGAAVLIYRGGDNARDPKSWEAYYRHVLDITDGLVIVDLAHGSEMAFDPNGGFKKSVAGQIACGEAVERIAEMYGEMPIGAMTEASSCLSPVDPPMPFNLALERGIRLNQLNNELSGAAVQVA